MATKIQGLDRLKRKLQAFPDAARLEISKAMEEGAQEMVNLARSLVRIGTTMQLHDSINWTWGDAPQGSIKLGTVRQKGKGSGNMAITVYAGNSDAFYARWVEFGTSGHVQGGMFAGSEHPGTAAQPYFYPAYRAVRKRIKSRITRAISKSTKRVASGG